MSYKRKKNTIASENRTCHNNDLSVRLAENFWPALFTQLYETYVNNIDRYIIEIISFLTFSLILYFFFFTFH